VLLSNFAIDGASTESDDAMETVCKFLEGKAHYLGSSDNKHNPKNDHYHLISGSCIGNIGNYVTDC
jgi:hypothetical protein